MQPKLRTVQAGTVGEPVEPYGNLDYLTSLERASAALEPDRDTWNVLVRDVTAYARRFVDTVTTRPAFVTTKDQGAGLLASPIAEEGISLDAVLDLLDRNVDNVGANLGSGRFLGYIPGGGLVPSAFGDFLAAITTQYAGVFFSSPGAVRMENMLVRWMAHETGLPASTGGFLSSGGSMANLSAIVTAREAHAISARETERAVVYLTDHAHHCVDKGLRIAGLGTCVQRRIPVDADYRMIPEQLEAAVADDKAAGLRPWLVVATAGTTNTGTVDPLPELAEIARAHRLWFHVDGAYGAFFALCPEGQRVLRGMDRADSLVLDPHKTLFVPFGTGALLVRDGEAMGRAHGGLGAYMLDMEVDANEPSPAYVSPELSKHFRGLRMWLPLKLLGVAPFRAALSEKIRLAHYFHEKLQSINGFEVGPTPDLSIATYRYVPESGDPDAFNQMLVRRIRLDGRIFVTSTRLHGATVLRLAVLSFRTHLTDIDFALEVLRENAEALAET